MYPTVQTLDVHFDNKPGIIGVYCIEHRDGIVLVDCGPGSTLPVLLDALRAHDLTAQDVTDVLLTHIHLDHAGAAGWWAQQGARIHVHPVGAPHLLNPEKLLASAQRIYGADMQRLWGSFLPVPADKLIEHHDDDAIEIGGRTFVALDTPGHAEHHFAYLFEDVCFSGDVGGVRVGGLTHVRPPTPPPEIHFEKWRASIARLRQAAFQIIAPTHFGLHADKTRHLDALASNLGAIENWMVQEMRDPPTPEVFRAHFAALMAELARADGYSLSEVSVYGDAAGTDMSADGVYRYWKKFRAA
ncbi:MAG: MBL fold metallo-hydrolase [Chloroflexi bacterium]|nr:MBL fold metallo-hydrolase [Chloroflexota bacterium]